MDTFKKILLIVLLFMGGGVLADDLKAATKVGRCNEVAAEFRPIYLDNLMAVSRAPGEEEFLESISNETDDVQMQVYLWYVYRNPDLINAFFKKIDPARLVSRRSDAINRILWLIFDLLKSSGGEVDEAAEHHISQWKLGFSKRRPVEDRSLNLYAGKYADLKAVADGVPLNKVVDVDQLLQRAIVLQASGKPREALGIYTEAASYGYSKALSTAALLLPTVGGRSCVHRAAYYVLISGVIGPISWIPASASKN